MLSMVLKIDRRDEFLEYQEQFSHLIRKIYNNIDKITDPIFKKKSLDRCPLLDIMAWESAIILSKMRKSRHEAIKLNHNEKLEVYKKEICKYKDNKCYDYYILNRKIKKLEKIICKSSDAVFGSKELLQNITYNKNMYNKTKDKKYLDIYNDKKKIYKSKRIQPFFVIGKGCEGGNRKFDFDFLNYKITFKPSKGLKYEIKIKPSLKQYAVLFNLQKMIDKDEISITVSLKTNQIILTYDECKLNGYEFKSLDCKKDQKGIIDKDYRKQIWLKHIEEQHDRMNQGKIISRVCAIDMNPDNIGVCIMDAGVVIYKSNYSLKKTIAKVKGNETNKIKNALGIIYARIFRTCTHYRVSKFGIEDLNFKQYYTKCKSLNHKIQNLWCREYQLQLVIKHCNIKGIELCKVNPRYTSFMGNLIYGFYDPISSAAEVARRTLILTKILDEEWYPVKRLLLDSYRSHVPNLEHLSVAEMYHKFISLKLKYRRVELPPHKLETALFDLYTY